MRQFLIDNINKILLFIFFVLTGVLILLSNENGTCSSENNSLFQVDKTHLFGNECESSAMFWLVCALAVMIQIARNILWIKNNQATRQTLKVKSSKRSFHLLLPLLMYTFISTSLYIFSILIILGGNIIILLFILLGNLLGVALSMSEQDADKERLATAILTLKCQWEHLSNKNYKELTQEEKEEYKNMSEVKEWIQSWVLNQPSDQINKESPLQITF